MTGARFGDVAVSLVVAGAAFDEFWVDRRARSVVIFHTKCVSKISKSSLGERAGASCNLHCLRQMHHTGFNSFCVLPGGNGSEYSTSAVAISHVLIKLKSSTNVNDASSVLSRSFFIFWDVIFRGRRNTW